MFIKQVKKQRSKDSKVFFQYTPCTNIKDQRKGETVQYPLPGFRPIAGRQEQPPAGS
jgi:hypothetical protein